MLHGAPGPDDRPLADLDGGGVRLHVDVFGSAFALLTRYEEALPGERDRFGRFPAQHTLSALDLLRPGAAKGDAWRVATVPGTVLQTLVDRGVYPDPAYGLNNTVIPERLARQDYWYRTEFDVPAEAAGKRQVAEQAREYAAKDEGFFRNIWYHLNGERTRRATATVESGHVADDAAARVSALTDVVAELAARDPGGRVRQW